MFDTEQKLIDEITYLLETSSSKVPRGLRYKNQVIMKEVNLGYGIADIVLTQCSDYPEKRGKFLSLTEIKLLNIINETPSITIDAIMGSTKISKRKINDALSSLENLGLAQTVGGGLTPMKKYVSTVQNTIAIEAKLRNWKRALKQAYRYKWFSHKSFVCLPSSAVGPASKHIDLFKKMGVGLIHVCDSKGIKVLHNPESERPISKDMSILFNECVLSQIYASL